MSVPRLVRRVVVMPIVICWHLFVLVSCPIAFGVACVVAVLTRSSRPVRTVAVVTTYSMIELAALGRVLRLRRAARGRPADDALDAQWHALVRWVVETSHGAVGKLLDVGVVVEEGSATPAEVAAADGVIVLARHCGPGDTLLIAWLLVVHYRLRLRIVLKSLLRLVPTVDLAGDMLPFYFVGSRPETGRAGIAQLASGLQAGQAILLFPEGGNFSRKRWVAAVRHIARSGQLRRARRLRRNRYTLPPHLGGVSAALQAAPDAAVLLVAHSGFGDDGRERPWWRLPVSQQLVVRTLFVPASQVPRDRAAIRTWLDDAWTRIDTWVDGHAALSSLSELKRSNP